MIVKLLAPPAPGAIESLDAECLDPSGQLRVMPASFYAGFSRNDVAAWCVKRGWYCLPTAELVAFIGDQIGGDPAIEIGAGNGALGRALGIPLTDSRQQERTDMQALYGALEQATISYGADVEKLTALEAVEQYRPTVVVGAWVTHRWNPAKPANRGNMHGVDEERLLEKRWVKRYVFVGHEGVHVEQARKPLLSRRHETHRLPYLYSRSPEPRDVVWIWRK